jgi:hypothetical protein
MIPAYHTSSGSGTRKLARIDYALMATATFAAFWYAMVPSFWEAATDAKLPRLSFWVTWYPLFLALAGAVVVGAAVRRFSRPILGGLDQKTRTALVLGIVIVSVLMAQRVTLIQDLTKKQEAYLDRCVSYLEDWEQRRQQLETELSTWDRQLSAILEQDQSAPRPEIDAMLETLRDQVDAALETVTNLAADLDRARESAAKVESTRAQDFRASGGSALKYRQSLATRQPGVELLSTNEASDPLIRVQAIGLAAQLVVAGTSGNERERAGTP